MYHRLCLYVIATFLIVAAISCGSGKKTRDITVGTGGKSIEISEHRILSGIADTLKLGIIREGEIVMNGFSFKNSTKIPVVIDNIDSGCGCITFGYSKEPIKPEEKTSVEVRFDSRGLLGEIYRVAYIKTTASQKPVMVVIEALVK